MGGFQEKAEGGPDGDQQRHIGNRVFDGQAKDLRLDVFPNLQLTISLVHQGSGANKLIFRQAVLGGSVHEQDVFLFGAYDKLALVEHGLWVVEITRLFIAGLVQDHGLPVSRSGRRRSRHLGQDLGQNIYLLILGGGRKVGGQR